MLAIGAAAAVAAATPVVRAGVITVAIAAAAAVAGGAHRLLNCGVDGGVGGVGGVNGATAPSFIIADCCWPMAAAGRGVVCAAAPAPAKSSGGFRKMTLTGISLRSLSSLASAECFFAAAAADAGIAAPAADAAVAAVLKTVSGGGCVKL